MAEGADAGVARLAGVAGLEPGHVVHDPVAVVVHAVADLGSQGEALDGVTSIPEAVAVPILLAVVRVQRAVVALVADAIEVLVVSPSGNVNAEVACVADAVPVFVQVPAVPCPTAVEVRHRRAAVGAVGDAVIVGVVRLPRHAAVRASRLVGHAIEVVVLAVADVLDGPAAVAGVTDAVPVRVQLVHVRAGAVVTTVPDAVVVVVLLGRVPDGVAVVLGIDNAVAVLVPTGSVFWAAGAMRASAVRRTGPPVRLAVAVVVEPVVAGVELGQDGPFARSPATSAARLDAGPALAHVQPAGPCIAFLAAARLLLHADPVDAD